jgi:beta-N-acetylhexosaminidase
MDILCVTVYASDPPVVAKASVIVGIKGIKLTDDEKAYLKQYQPVGVILHKYNCNDEKQVRELTASIKELGCLVCIDIEGKLVNRLSGFLQLEKNQRDFEHLKSSDVYSYFAGIAKHAKDLGIDVIFAPVTDVADATNEAASIGARSFSNEPAKVAMLAFAVVAAFQDNGIIPVIKHLPGHGKAKTDSHLALPYVSENIEKDIAANRALIKMLKAYGRRIPPCIVAHVVYSGIEKSPPGLPATLSPHVIQEIVRKDIGIGKDGIVISDCFCMGAIREFKNAEDLFYQAGGDIIICSLDVESLVKKGGSLLTKKKLPQEKYAQLSQEGGSH